MRPSYTVILVVALTIVSLQLNELGAEEVFYPIFVMDEDIIFQTINSSEDISGLAQVRGIILTKNNARKFLDSIRREKLSKKEHGSGEDLITTFDPVGISHTNLDGRMVAKLNRNKEYHLFVRRGDEDWDTENAEMSFRFAATKQGMLLANIENGRAEVVFRLRSREVEADYERQFEIENANEKIKEIVTESEDLVGRYNEIHTELLLRNLSRTTREMLEKERKRLGKKISGNQSRIEEYEKRTEEQLELSGFANTSTNFTRIQAREFPISVEDMRPPGAL